MTRTAGWVPTFRNPGRTTASNGSVTPATGTARARRLTLGNDVRPVETVSERDGAPIPLAGERPPRPRPGPGGRGARAPPVRRSARAAPGGGSTAPGSADAARS